MNYDKDDNLTSYTYDGTGMRTGKTTNNITTKFCWDRGYIVNEYENDVASATNVVGNTGIIGRKENNQLSYFFKNAHGDVVATSQLL